MAPRYAGYPRRWHRNREASELAALRQRTLLYPISAPATWRHQRGFTATATSKATATATATVAARSHKQPQQSLRGANSNRNGRCAGNGNGTARCAEKTNATEPVAMLTGVPCRPAAR